MSERYRTVADADAYFANQLYADDWTTGNAADKDKAILAASRSIDSLLFSGLKNAVYDKLVSLGYGIAGDSAEALEAAADELTPEVWASYEALQTKQFPRGGSHNSVIESWTITNTATGGNYTLTVNGETTGNIAYDASDGDILTAIETLTGVSSGVFSVSSGVITWTGDDGYIVANDVDLSGGSVVVTVLDDNIPDPIFWAVCEEAKSLLSGRDPEQEYQNLVLTSDGAGSTRASMDRTGIPPQHSANFITSPLAWRYLVRYLKPNTSFEIRKV